MTTPLSTDIFDAGLHFRPRRRDADGADALGVTWGLLMSDHFTRVWNLLSNGKKQLFRRFT